jgi:uncharacterized membrane protein
MRRAVLTAVVALVLFMWAWALVTWSVAPDRVPLHFGLSGQPDRWGPRTVASWFGMPILAIAMVLGMSWLGRWSLSRPERINMPGKDRLESLPEGYREPVYEALRELMAWAMLETVGILALIQWGIIRGAAGEGTRGVMALVLGAAVLGSPFLLVFMTVRSQRALDAAHQRARRDGALPLPESDRA